MRVVGLRVKAAASAGAAALVPVLAATALLAGCVAGAGAGAAPWWRGGLHDDPVSIADADIARMPEPPPFRLRLEREHPLAGRIYDVHAGRFVAPAQLEEALAGAELVLLGEQHDNADHHRLQAWLIGAVARHGRKPRVVFEMIDAEKQASVDRVLAEVPVRVDDLRKATEWDETGWPRFAIYRPVFAAAVDLRLPIVAAGLSRAALAKLAVAVAHDPGAEDPAARSPLPDAVRQAMADDIRASHCGYAHQAMVDAMIPVQRRRDAAMARALLATTGKRPDAILVAGFGHARTDYGVPMVVREIDASLTLRSVGFLEVQRGADDPQVYAEALQSSTLPFDYVWFTPRASDQDPCKKFRRQLQEMERMGVHKR